MVAVPEPETVPSRNPASVTVRPGAAARPPECREGQVDEELAGARRVQHRAVDGEQHDVGGGHVERHPVKAGRLEERRTDDLVPVHAGMGDRRALWQVAAVVGVAQREQTDDRQRRTGGAAAGLEHQEQHDRSDDDVDHRGSALPAEELVETASAACDLEWKHRIQAGDQRHRGEQPVHGCRGLGRNRRPRRPRRTPSIRDGGAAAHRSGSTAGSAVVPPPGSRSRKPGCPVRAGRTPDRSRTARSARTRR